MAIGSSIITADGINALANASATGTSVKPKYFKFSNQDLVLDPNLSASDLIGWRTQDINDYQKIDTQTIEFMCDVVPTEASDYTRVCGLFLEDGTLFMVAKPPYPFPPALRQTFKIQMIYQDVDELVSFKYLKTTPWKLKKPMIAFVFDDGYISHWDKANIFEDRGVVCGYAVNKAYLNYSGRVSFDQLKDLQSRGFEIINHSFSHIPQTGTVWEQSLQEIEQNYQILTENGLDIKGFTTPNSQLSNIDRIAILKRHHSYAYTIYNGGAVGSEAVFSETDGTSPYDLFRPECSSEVNSKITIDVIKETNGLTVFYGHDITEDFETTLINLVDYAQANGVEIVAPHIIAEEFARRKAIDYIKPKDIFTDKNIYTGHFGFSNNASVDVINVADIATKTNTITVTAGENVGQLVMSNVFTDHIASIENAEFVFSFLVNSTVVYDTGLTIGIRVTRASDNVVLFDNESAGVKIDGHEREYKISTGIFSSNEEFYFNVFFRLNGMGAENAVITIKEPFLHQGSIGDIIDRSVLSSNFLLKIPFDTTTVASSTRTAVNMVVSENENINIEATQIIFKKAGIYSLEVRCNINLGSDYTGKRLISSFIDSTGEFGLQSVKTVIATRANFDNSMLRYFNIGDTISFNIWQDTGISIDTVNDNAEYNFIEIVKLN